MEVVSILAVVVGVVGLAASFLATLCSASTKRVVSIKFAGIEISLQSDGEIKPGDLEKITAALQKQEESDTSRSVIDGNAKP
jgi:hypothetical protein